MFYGIRSAKNKMSEADPNLERSMTAHRGTETRLVYTISFAVKEVASTA